MPEQLPTEIELNFEKENLHKLYQTSTAVSGINPERWERVRREIRFDDLVSDLTGQTGTSIHCPFHGSDSRPSFWLYRGSNDGWCFGCPPHQNYYDHFRFVSKYLDISRIAALRWLEKKWELPDMPSTPQENEDEDVVVQLKFEDMQEPYIVKAVRQIQTFKDVELAEDYLCRYFEASQKMKWAKDAKTGIDYAKDFALTDHNGKPRTLADFKGKVVVMFFGYTQCPDVCPTTMAEMADVMKQLGPQADKVQVIFVTIDPERDTQALLASYVPNFDPRFLGMYGDAAATAKVAKEFKVYYQKVPGNAPDSYTMDHTAGSYVFDTEGHIRLFLRHGQGTAPVVHDLKLLLK